MKAALRQFLIDSNISSGRVFSFPVPHGTAFPHICITQISGQANYSSNGNTQLLSEQWQFDCYSNSEPEAVATAEALVDAFDAVNYPTILSGFRLHSARSAGIRDLSELENNSSDFAIYRREVQINIKRNRQIIIDPESSQSTGE